MDRPGRQQGLYFVFADGFDDNADICAFKRSSEVFRGDQAFTYPVGI